jgi:hypothetical protein
VQPYRRRSLLIEPQGDALMLLHHGEEIVDTSALVLGYSRRRIEPRSDVPWGAPWDYESDGGGDHHDAPLTSLYRMMMSNCCSCCCCFGSGIDGGCGCTACDDVTNTMSKKNENCEMTMTNLGAFEFHD